MKSTRHTKEQVIAILKQGKSGLTTADLRRQHGIAGPNSYREGFEGLAEVT